MCLGTQVSTAACRDDVDFRRALLDRTCKVQMNSFCALVTTLCTDDIHFHRVIYIYMSSPYRLKTQEFLTLILECIAPLKLHEICTYSWACNTIIDIETDQFIT